MFRFYDHLGFMTPYYSYSDEGDFQISQNFSEATSKLDKLNIDIPGVIQILSHYHCFGDRTLIKGLKRTPWLAKPSDDFSSWNYANIPPHGNSMKPVSEVVKTLENLLENELLMYLNGKKSVGILLSGGMDSRIIAAMLYKVKEKHQLSISITGLTWGMTESRDVQYAQRIAKILNWDWKHFNLNSENLKENIYETAINGCEFSPLHLHAMPKVRDYAEQEGLGCILAASYGDGIGRGEYSGSHITELKPVERYVRNWFKLIQPNIYDEFKYITKSDAVEYRSKYSHNSKLEELEIEKQSQYMRRQLNPCMGIINEAVPVYQLFSAPKIYEFMWSLDPRIRNNKIYEELLKGLMDALFEIPWARTGKKYLTNDGDIDSFKKEHSIYGEWVRNDLKSVVYDKISSNALNKLNIFNISIVEQLWEINQKHFNNKRHSKVEEILLWLSSLSEMINIFEIEPDVIYKKYKETIIEKFSSRAEISMYRYILKYKNIK